MTFMTFSPFDSPDSGLWMRVEDVFHIKGRGTVLTGRLDGTGELREGDMAACDGYASQVTRIEQFRAMVPVASPGASIGIMLRDNPPTDLIRGQTLQFTGSSGDAGPGPQFTVTPARKKRWGRKA